MAGAGAPADDGAMPPASVTLHRPTARGDLALLTGGRRGTYDDTFATAAAVLLDAALAGVVDVTGRRVLGIDRRRVVLGPGVPDPETDPLMADVRRRVEVADPDTPKGWCERLAVFAEDALARELVDAGVVRVREVALLRRMFAHRTLDPVDPGAAPAIAARLRAVAGGGASAADVALTLLLHETEMLSGTLGRRDARRSVRAAERGADALPRAARAVIDTLAERRRRNDSIGTYTDS